MASSDQLERRVRQLTDHVRGGGELAIVAVGCRSFLGTRSVKNGVRVTLPLVAIRDPIMDMMAPSVAGDARN